LYLRQARHTVAGRSNVEPFPLQVVAYELNNVLVILDDENPFHASTIAKEACSAQAAPAKLRNSRIQTSSFTTETRRAQRFTELAKSTRRRMTSLSTATLKLMST